MKSWGGNWLLWARRPCSGREDRQRPCTRACSGAVMVALGCPWRTRRILRQPGKNGGPLPGGVVLFKGSRGNRLELLLAALRERLGRSEAARPE